MRYWFHRYFEDPAEQTPYNSREGGYLYIWGGPYDAKEQLFDEFGSLIPEERIEEVGDELEGDGIYDWAPGPDHPDLEQVRQEWDDERRYDESPPEAEDDLDLIIDRLRSGLRPSYGDAYELERRREALQRLDQLKLALEAVAPQHGGIGHNRPPPDEDSLQVSVINDVREANEVIRKELAKPQPDALQIAEATSRLRKAFGWLGKKIDVAAESFAKGFGSAAGKATGIVVAASVGSNVPPLGKLIAEVVTYVSQWLSHVTMPF